MAPRARTTSTADAAGAAGQRAPTIDDAPGAAGRRAPTIDEAPGAAGRGAGWHGGDKYRKRAPGRRDYFGQRGEESSMRQIGPS